MDILNLLKSTNVKKPPSENFVRPRKACATCNLWSGPRSIVFLTTVAVSGNSTEGKCFYKPTAARTTMACGICSHWEKWTLLQY